MLLCAAAVLPSCGGGGGGDGSPPPEDKPPPALDERVRIAQAELVVQSPPAPSDDPAAPDTLPADDFRVGVTQGEPLPVELQVESSDGVAAILARIDGEEQYLEVENPVTPSGEESAGKSVALRQSYRVPLELTWLQIPPLAWECLDFAVRDFQNRVSNYAPICFEFAVPPVTR